VFLSQYRYGIPTFTELSEEQVAHRSSKSIGAILPPCAELRMAGHHFPLP
jgi:hypothetical protein